MHCDVTLFAISNELKYLEEFEERKCKTAKEVVILLKKSS